MGNDIKNIVKYTQDLTLLYVEDNKDAREATIPVFESIFNNIVTAIDGEDGVEKFLTNKIDIIITDINMPKLNGLEMIQKIKTYNDEIPILIISAHNDTKFFIDSIKMGVDGYILKPINVEQFFAILSKAIQKIRLQEDINKKILFLKQYEDVTNQSSIVSKTNTKGILTFVNDEFCRISGYTKEELIGKPHSIIRHPDNPKEIYEQMWDTIKNKKQIWKGIIRNIAKDGRSYYVKMTMKPILDKNNNIVEYIALRDDITEIMNPKRQLEYMVTNTKNILAIMIKIKDFKDIRKLYGHKITRQIEDKMEKLLINIPKECKFEKIFSVGEGKYVFARNKDECDFNMDTIISNVKKFQKDIDDIKIDIAGISYDTSVIISLAYDEDILENLHYGIEKLEETDENFIISNGFAKNIRENARKNLETISMVKTAIENNKIVSYFQPIVENQTKQIHKYESLVRLIDQTGKVLSPYFFLDISKKGKYYSQITKIVLKNSFEALKKVPQDISMNISALDIELPSTQQYIFELLEEYKQYTHRVVFELLEDEGVKHFKTILDFINKVKSYGVKIAIDDFGAGYSNFERLLDYQPDILKIDGCLIKNILDDNYSLSIVRTIVAFAKEQNIQTVAEFVETKEVYELLKSLNIDYTQGYYFGKPKELGE